MAHATLIEQLGDTGAVAQALGQNDSTVSMWKQRSIPWRWRPAVAALAKSSNIPLPDGFLEAAPLHGRAA